MEKTKEEWRKHPSYLADVGGCFGAPPQLKCQYCGKSCYEIFYGHCKKCAKDKEIPRETAEPQDFHDALNNGTSVVVQGVPETWKNAEIPKKVVEISEKQYPWWHWRRWFTKK